MGLSDHHADIIGMWRNKASGNYAYFDLVESKAATDPFWAGDTVFRKMFDTLDISELLEIACGQGRHSARVPKLYRRMALLDTSVAAIDVAKERFKDNPNVLTILSADGCTIDQRDNSFTAVFSYDAIVHFEPITVAAYLKEIARVLKPGGRALLHHSVYDKNPAGVFTTSANWRNYMTRDLFLHFASRAHLAILHQNVFAWGAVENSDALTLLEKAVL